MRRRLDDIGNNVADPRLAQAREKLDLPDTVRSGASDPEAAKQAMDDVQEAKRLLALVRKEHLKEIRQIEMDRVCEFFDEVVREYARPSEASSFDNLVRTAQRAIENNSSDFEAHLDDLRGRLFMILWRQDWFVVSRFKQLAESTHLFPNAQEHAQLVTMGTEALRADDMEKLRGLVAQLDSIRIGSAGADEMMAAANIVRT